MEAGKAAREGILRVHPDAEVVIKPLADGGEGTTEALIEGLSGERITLTVTGPYGQPVEAYYGIIPESNTAVIEMAQAAGITLDARRDPWSATSFGVGEMIADAFRRGCRRFIVGIGGSATNDGGIGMLTALGVNFSDEKGACPGQGAQALGKIADLSLESLIPGLNDCEFLIACDVNNPLCGENGATSVFGPQKGVAGTDIPIIDQSMKQYAGVAARCVGHDYSCVPGAGAAGGLGFAFLYALRGRLVSGIDLILDTIGLEEAIRNADIVITGEGRLDAQTTMGKAPSGVASLAKKHGKKVIAFAGSVSPDARKCNEAGIDAFFPILRSVCSLEEAMNAANAYRNLCDTAEQVFRAML